MKAVIALDFDGRFFGIRVACAYCGMHTLPVRWLPPGQTESPHAAGKPHWDFNGDFERPTLSPSILCTDDLERDSASWVCHSFVRDGRIEYLPDCTHDGRGKTVTLNDAD